MKCRRLPSLVIVAALVMVGCSGGDDAAGEAGASTTTTEVELDNSEFCAAYDDMLQAQQQWTVAYLVSLDEEEAAQNRAEQDAAAAPVEALLPSELQADWDEVSAVGDRVVELIEELRPPGGTLEDALAESRAQGFGSNTEFVFRNGIEVDGRTWTFEEYIAAGGDMADRITDLCETLP